MDAHQPFENLTQGSEEWLAARRSLAWTASELGALVGCGDSYERRGGVLMRKSGLETDRSRNAAMTYGSEHEDAALESLKRFLPEQHDWTVHSTQRPGLLQKQTADYVIGASPDAIMQCESALGVKRAFLVEIKCPFRDRKLLNPALKVSRQWYLQVQQNLYVSGLRHGILYVWTPTRSVIFFVRWHPTLWQRLWYPRAVWCMVACEHALRLDAGKRKAFLKQHMKTSQEKEARPVQWPSTFLSCVHLDETELVALAIFWEELLHLQQPVTEVVQNLS